MTPTKTTTPAIKHRPRDPGLWVEDSLVESLPELGRDAADALYLYCVLGLADSLDEYPSAGTLASVLGCREDRVWDLMQALHDAGAINDHDVQAVHVATMQTERVTGYDDEGGGGPQGAVDGDSAGS